MVELKFDDEYYNSPGFKELEKKTGRDRIWSMLSLGEETPELLEMLKQAEDVDKCDKYGTSYLDIAAQEHKLKAIEILLDRGADPNGRNTRGGTAVLSAIGRKDENNPAILKAFLEHGLDLDAVVNGMTVREHILSFDDDEYNALLEQAAQ